MHVHFMGIGGSGVSGLSLMAKSMGYSVSGCDVQESPYFKMVKEKGVDCRLGHSPDHLSGVDLVVRSSAISVKSSEIREALAKGLNVISRGSFLSMLMKDRDVIGIAGSHGKTSTTWMVYHILKRSGINPSVYAGGKSNGISNISEGAPYIIELDESDGSIFEIRPQTLVINNLEFEHADYYSTPAEMLTSFERYLLSWKPENLVIGRGYDLSDSLFYEFNSGSFPTVDEIKKGKSFQNVSGFDFYCRDGVWYFLSNSNEIIAGSQKDPAHILQNRFASLLVSAKYLKLKGMKLPDIDYRSLWDLFPKIERRFEVVGEYKGVCLIDDYAHHPSEVRAMLEQAELKYKNFCVIFQPHRVSRFTAFYDKFFEVLRNVEPLIILPVYKAGEKQKGADSKSFFERIKNTGNEVYYFESTDEVGVFLENYIEKLHVSAVVAAGAGDLNTVFKYLEKK